MLVRRLIPYVWKNETGQTIILVVIYELFTTVLPLLVAMMFNPQVREDFSESPKGIIFIAIIGALSSITYFTSDDLSGLICLVILAGLPLMMRKGYGVSWGRAFGTLGLFILFNFIAIFIAELIIDAVLE